MNDPENLQAESNKIDESSEQQLNDRISIMQDSLPATCLVQNSLPIAVPVVSSDVDFATSNFLQQGSKFSSHTDFVVAVQEYAMRQGFTMRLHKLKRNREGAVRWREIVCSRSGSSCKKKVGERPTRNRLSQRCRCPFLIRASANGVSGLWEVISTNFSHNHELGSNSGTS
ncbi:16762_t:CDS:1 [Acaulospora morrowiae]|uniref:16762_t:CDS:1 n=1 Tax=Acaulospora morrowiae TaxID=94023 RepID=A0A9N9HBZ9_9GLOM|nr:16762_t:CDS:1 [Acaulospora morrowiae]